ncbi:MAG: hypothetical protein M1833_006840 [Piccolia ochrophora]|nr:MAG: hypothetical protein M1833_006840 [Piccolia ochrophora]
MSLTATLSPAPVPARSSTHSCPNCGVHLPSPSPSPLSRTHSSPPNGAGDTTATDTPQDAQRRIAELEAQVKILTGKATAAVDKLADYEDELRRLKTTPSTAGPTSSPTTTVHPPSPSTSPVPPPPLSAAAAAPSPSPSPNPVSRFSSLLPSRKAVSSPSPSGTPTQPHPPSTQQTTDLHTALQHERHLRAQAEGQLSAASLELEELSTALFGQANEMVATERRARAKLEERVEVLERRDREKRGRLERLEKAVGRVERVRGLLGERGR